MKKALVIITIRAFFASLGAVLAVTLMINIGMVLAARNHVFFDINDVPPRTAVLVLGSQSHGTKLSPVLEDRVKAGISLIEKQKGKKLLLSGDHGKPFYDEVTAMRLYVIENAPSIRDEDIFLDHAGFSTWDSMYRARNVFEVEDILIVTQVFHISRAVSMARSLGMDAVGYGVNQDRFAGPSLRYWRFREYFARVKAFSSIIFKPSSRYLGDRIPISGDGRSTWI